MTLDRGMKHFKDRYQEVENDRSPEADVTRSFLKRWSPRSFEPEAEFEKASVLTLMEAARWAPSSFNAQPWHFLLSLQGTADFNRFLKLLTETNQIWAKHASLLGFICARRDFPKNGKPNRHYAFDCGSAWMSLTIQAREMGLYTHGMAGVQYEAAEKELNVPDGWDVICAFVVGQAGDPAKLPDKLREQEHPNRRNELDSIYSFGNFITEIKNY